MKNDKAHIIAFTGIMFALIFVLFILETTVLQPFGMTACILSLPVSIALSIYDGWRKSFIGVTLLGICSCISCFIFPAFIQYANPLISILPRFLVGVIAYWAYYGFSKLLKRCKSKYLIESLPAALAGMLGSISNTVLYLTASNLLLGGAFADALNTIVSVALTIYFPIELIACFILVPIYVKILKKVTHTESKVKTAKLSNEERL